MRFTVAKYHSHCICDLLNFRNWIHARIFRFFFHFPVVLMAIIIDVFIHSNALLELLLKKIMLTSPFKMNSSLQEFGF